MTCCIFGPGLVGSFLGAAANAHSTQSRQLVCQPIDRLVELPTGRVRWQPHVTTNSLVMTSLSEPLLVTTRFHHTSWDTLPAHALAAQNGLGQPIAVIVCFLALDRDTDGVIRCLGIPRLVVPLQTEKSPWTAVYAAWRQAGLHIDEVADGAPAQWEKAILNATVGPLCLATGLSMAEVWAERDLRQLVLAATTEGYCIARHHHINIASGIEERAAEFFARIGAHRPSVLTDAGELPHILGYLRQRAQEPTPALDAIAALVAAGPVAAGPVAAGQTHRTSR